MNRIMRTEIWPVYLLTDNPKKKAKRVKSKENKVCAPTSDLPIANCKKK